MMEGVVQRGTAMIVKKILPNVPIAGKTGTTNDEKDAWFIGFSPDLVVGVYLGYDKPRHLGRGATGGVLAAPIVRDFMLPNNKLLSGCSAFCSRNCTTG